MAASNPSGSKPGPEKTFRLAIGCADARAGAFSTLMYNGLLKRGGPAFTSLRQGRLVLTVEIYKPAGRKTAPRAKKSAKKTSTSRGR
jgi:hypothetical protein